MRFVHSFKCQYQFFVSTWHFLPSKVVFSSDLSLRFVPIIVRDNFISGNSTQLAILALMGHQHMPWGNPLLSELYWSYAIQSATDFFFAWVRMRDWSNISVVCFDSSPICYLIRDTTCVPLLPGSLKPIHWRCWKLKMNFPESRTILLVSFSVTIAILMNTNYSF